MLAFGVIFITSGSFTYISGGCFAEIQQGNYGDRLKEEAMAVRSASGGIGGISGIGGVSGMGISGAGRGTSTTGFETFGDGGGRYTMEREFNGSLVGTLPPSYREGGTLNMAYVENYFADVSNRSILFCFYINMFNLTLKKDKQYGGLVFWACCTFDLLS